MFEQFIEFNFLGLESTFGSEITVSCNAFGAINENVGWNSFYIFKAYG